MKLGFVSAILPELDLAQVLADAHAIGFDCVEAMCWPVGKAERRYAGVTHVDVNDFDAGEAHRVLDVVSATGVELSALGYYPNPLAEDSAEGVAAVAHLCKVIRAARLLGLDTVNTFLGRDRTKTVEDNWPRFLEVWRPLIALAADEGVRIAIEHCPMSFTCDEWPGGKNMAASPAIWRRMFNDIPSANFGLNYDPSHMVWQQMDYLKPLREFKDRIFHVHAKDARVDRERLDDVGILAYPNEYHTPKLPGLGDVDWGRFFSTLTDIGYHGPVCVEVEDRAYEGSIENRNAALRQSYAFLRQYVPAR